MSLRVETSLFQRLAHRMQIEEMESTAGYFAIRGRRIRLMLTIRLSDAVSFLGGSYCQLLITELGIVAAEKALRRFNNRDSPPDPNNFGHGFRVSLLT